MDRPSSFEPPKTKVIVEAQDTKRESGPRAMARAWDRRAAEVCGDVERVPTDDQEHELGHLCMIGEIDAEEAYARVPTVPGVVGGVAVRPTLT